ncbi:hypothetical protein QCM77_45165 [Bradyrhizobium sp. SSUT18]|uniref:hypothetical protein n=1 Tax=Bradyrhizobium sp. SSUT18 TaxID=3040602 RepID=UPI00244B4369|nr:hypothetical protein [Bradyrhizobium sp. SSUT18]MDH2406960.1 hypothetical protein [Bradyrhizobium sp. SSUT18]
MHHKTHLTPEKRNELIVDAGVIEPNGGAQRDSTLHLIKDNASADGAANGSKNCGTADFLAGCHKRGCTSHFSEVCTNCRLGIYGGTARPAGHRICTIKCKRNPDSLGQIKTIRQLREAGHCGRALVE